MCLRATRIRPSRCGRTTSSDAVANIFRLIVGQEKSVLSLTASCEGVGWLSVIGIVIRVQVTEQLQGSD